MAVSLQKANFWKRISAYLFDTILTVMVVIGLAAALSALLGYETHTQKLESYYTKYEETYGVDFDITQEDFDALTEAEQEKYNEASEAFGKDPEVQALYSVMFTLTLVIISISALIGILAFYFIVPLFFKYGRTLGKKVFGLAVVRTNCVKASNPVLFVRAILGQYTIETMFPILLFLMVYFGLLGSVGTITLLLFAVLQIAVLAVTKTNSAIHDLLSDTVVVDMASQQIFETQDALLEYQKQQALEAQNPESL